MSSSTRSRTVALCRKKNDYEFISFGPKRHLYGCAMQCRLWVLALVTPACFAPRFNAPRCNETGECPAGLVCNASLECVAFIDDADVPPDSDALELPVDMSIDMPIDANPNLLAFDLVIRDFRGIDLTPPGHPDFESPPTGDVIVPGLVEPVLVNGRPVLSATHPSIQSADSFSHWYADTAQNMKVIEPVVLARTSGGFTYAAPMFFPLDSQGFVGLGTEPLRMGHNFSFTTEAQISFTYLGGETISFTGDDDVWIFVDGHLVIDLGGRHSPKSGSVTLTPGVAATIGLVAGNAATISVFQAERHTTGSSYQLVLDGVVP
jgi:fibro-slime domain-containing protein